MNKSKFLKKSLAAILSVLLVVAMIPLSAAAAVGELTSFTVNGSVATINGTNITATVKSATGVVLGAVCDDGTTVKGVDKNGDPIPFGTTTSWTTGELNLNTVAEQTSDNVYTLKIVTSASQSEDDSTKDVEYTLTITVEQNGSSGENLVKTVKDVTGMVDYDVDDAANTITITLRFGAETPDLSQANFTYSDNYRNAELSGDDKTLTVTAENGNTKIYTVKTVWQSAFKSFSVEGQTADAEIKTDGTNDITVKMPYGTQNGQGKVALTFELADGFKSVKTTVNGTSDASIVSGRTKVDIIEETIILTLVKNDGTDEAKKVTVNLDIPTNNAEALLKSIKVSSDGATSNVVDVDKDTRTISVEMPNNTDFTKSATVDVVASASAELRIVEQDLKIDADSSTGKGTFSGVNISGQTFTIRVVSADKKTTTNYTINLTKAAVAENKLTNLTLKGKIDGESFERSADINGTTATIKMPYAFANSANQGSIKVYATSSVGSTIVSVTSELGNSYTDLLDAGVVPEINANKTSNKIDWVVKNDQNGSTTYTIKVELEAPRTGKAFLGGTLVGTKNVKEITENNTYAVSAPANDSNNHHAVKVTVPYSFDGDALAFSVLTLSPGAVAYTRSGDAYVKLEALDADETGNQNDVASLSVVSADFTSAYDNNTVDTTGKAIPVYVFSEKVAVDMLSSISEGNWNGANAETYYFYGEKAAAESGNTITAMKSTVDTNVTASVNNSTQVINITVPYSYNQDVFNDSTAKKFSLDFTLSKMATLGPDTGWVSDLGSKDTTGRTMFCVENGELKTVANGTQSAAITEVEATAENGTVRKYSVNVKVNDAETGFALTGVSAVCGSNTGTGSISGNTVNLVMPFGSKLFPAKLTLTASKMATIKVDGGDYDADKLFDLNSDVKVTVTAEDGKNSQVYTIKTTLGVRFTDVPSNVWFAPYVEEASTLGIIEGLGNGVFGPYNPIRRQDFVTMIGRMLLGTNYTNDSAINFTDEDQIGDYAKPYVAYFVSKEVISGYGDGTFNPNGYITRSEAAKIIAAALELNVAGTPSFADTASIAAWAQPYVAACQTAAIFTGDSNNRFNGSSNITRAEAAKVMVESYKIK